MAPKDEFCFILHLLSCGHDGEEIVEDGFCLFGSDGEIEVLACCISCVVGIALVGHDDSSCGRYVEELLRVDGIEDGGEVLGGTVLYLLEIDFIGIDDGMMLGPGEVVLDASGGIAYLVAKLEGRHIDGRWPVGEDVLAGCDIVDNIILGMLGVLDVSCHHNQALHLLGNQFLARQGRVFVGFCVKEQGEVGAEADGDDGHGCVFCLCQQFAIKLHGGKEATVVLDASLVERLAVLVGHLADDLCIVCTSHDALAGSRTEADRDSFLMVPCVEQVDVLGRVLALLVQHDGHEFDASLPVVLVEHIEGKRIVHIVAHVGLKDDVYPLCPHPTDAAKHRY